MKRSDGEYGTRGRAVRLHRAGVPFSEICRRLRRSRGWLSKWLHRFRSSRWAGLRTQSRRPRRIPRRSSRAVVARIVGLRAELEAHRTRRTRYRGVGAAEIQDLLRAERRTRVPSLSTIERVLRREGVGRAPRRRHGSGQPYPRPRATRPGDLQQTDLVGPRYLRGPRGVTRFYSMHTIASVGRGVWASQTRHKTAEALCAHFVAAWRWLGVPRVSQMDNEMAATGGGRHAYGLSLVIRLHLLLGGGVVFVPPGEPGRNQLVEWFNGAWQDHVLIHHCPDLRALRRVSLGYCRFYHNRRANRGLSVRHDGTRYPGAWLLRHHALLHGVPREFDLAAYRDARGRLHLPVARGQVSWIQKVDPEGFIAINARPYSIGKRRTGEYVQATLFTHRRRVVVYSARHRRIRSFPFVITEPIVAPLR